MVNKTRMFLQVETVAEISNLEGTRTDPVWLADGEKTSWSTLKLPKVGKPSKKMWRAWKTVININAQQEGDLRD